VDGSVRLGDTDILALPEAAMRDERGGRMGMIFQEPMTSLNPVLTIGDQISESIKVHDPGARSDINRRVLELLDAVGIPDPQRRMWEYPHQLSGGMKQRVMIAIALAGKPELLIADEPTTALDVTIQAQVLKLLKDLQQESGMAIMLITHDLGVVSEVADRVAVMYAGQIVEVATREQFFKQPQHPYSRKLFDSLPGKARRGQPLAVIKGFVPQLNQEFKGCRFADRCEEIMDICHEQIPLWSEVGSAQGVRCHLHNNSNNRGQTPIFLENRGLSPIVPSPTSPIVPSPTSPIVPKSTTSLLKVDDLKVHFPIQKGVLRRTVGNVKAVDGVSMDITTGHTLALVGESGCGKTTVGKGILQLIRPTAGSANFDGDELTQLKGKDLRRRRADMQIIFQDPMASMNPRMLVGDIIAEGMQAQGIGKSREERRERVAELLGKVGLSADAATRYPHEFSGGQRQRICVARALAVDPMLIVCDEPTSALDVSVQAQILNLLKDLQDDLDLSYLFITHNISVVAYLAHDVAVMYLGRIVEQGTVQEVLESPQHPYTKALLSAVPVVDQESKREVIRLEGDMPSPANPPAGCHFHPRCPEATPECQQEYPQQVQLSDTRVVSCIKLNN
jgi:peptide/nickel transport system ATP-binding protein